jgi:hypothetical protein
MKYLKKGRVAGRRPASFFQNFFILADAGVLPARPKAWDEGVMPSMSVANPADANAKHANRCHYSIGTVDTQLLFT